jgi:hypothetical protein
MPSIQVTENITFTHFTWLIHDVIKNTSCRLLIQLRNNALPEGDDIVHKIWFNMTGDDYANWAEDDSYIDGICEREIAKL